MKDNIELETSSGEGCVMTLHITGSWHLIEI